METVTAFQIAKALNNKDFATVKYPDDYKWVRLTEIEADKRATLKQVKDLEISVLEMFAYQGPPSRRWIETQGKYYEGWNAAIKAVLQVLQMNKTQEVFISSEIENKKEMP
jgi:hypothetical protein